MSLINTSSREVRSARAAILLLRPPWPLGCMPCPGCRAVHVARQVGAGQDPDAGVAPEFHGCRFAILDRQPEEEPRLGRRAARARRAKICRRSRISDDTAPGLPRHAPRRPRWPRTRAGPATAGAHRHRREGAGSRRWISGRRRRTPTGGPAGSIAWTANERPRRVQGLPRPRARLRVRRGRRVAVDLRIAFVGEDAEIMRFGQGDQVAANSPASPPCLAGSRANRDRRWPFGPGPMPEGLRSPAETRSRVAGT